MRALLATALTALSLFVAATAFAQEGGQDEVTLKNGGVIRGIVVSSEPGTSVKIIEMGQKEVRVIPWSQVSDVERGKYAPKSALPQPGPAGPGYGMAPPPQTLPPPEPQLGAPGVVRLHIDSPVPTQLIEHAGTTVGAYGGYGVVLTTLRPVCAAPCDRVIDGSRGQGFTVTGPFPTPGLFDLTELRGDVTLSVKPGSIGKRVGGVWLTILGGTTFLTGVIMLPLVLNRTTTSLRDASIGMTAVGGAALVGGIVLLATSGTKLRLDQGAPRLGPAAQIKPRYWLGEF
jgi:hypothetical protein